MPSLLTVMTAPACQCVERRLQQFGARARQLHITAVIATAIASSGFDSVGQHRVPAEAAAPSMTMLAYRTEDAPILFGQSATSKFPVHRRRWYGGALVGSPP
jgi:hypothetical protein